MRLLKVMKKEHERKEEMKVGKGKEQRKIKKFEASYFSRRKKGRSEDKKLKETKKGKFEASFFSRFPSR
jgi:hypothetical protein